MRTPGSLVGHREPICDPPESDQLDYEGEIVIVIGNAGRRIAEADAERHIAGLTLMNEGSIRDWSRHCKFNVTQGKNWERSGRSGRGSSPPTRSPARHLPSCMTTRVNGELRQDDTTANLIFPFAQLIDYMSSFTTLQPGDLIATGTPTGAGARFDPPKYLAPATPWRSRCPRSARCATSSSTKGREPATVRSDVPFSFSSNGCWR